MTFNDSVPDEDQSEENKDYQSMYEELYIEYKLLEDKH